MTELERLQRKIEACYSTTLKLLEGNGEISRSAPPWVEIEEIEERLNDCTRLIQRAIDLRYHW